MKFGDLRPRGDSEFLPRERKAMTFGDLRPRNLSQETPKDNGGFLDSAINLGNWWKGNSLASAGYLGGLLSETAGNILQGIGEKFDEGTLPRRALEGAGQISQSVADKMLDFSEKNFDVADENTASGNIANQLMSGLTGSLGSLGRMIHADKSADALKKASESTAEKNRVSTDDLPARTAFGVTPQTLQGNRYQRYRFCLLSLSQLLKPQLPNTEVTQSLKD